MAQKRKKPATNKKPRGGLFFVHKHLRWLLPLFGLSVLFLFLVTNKPTEEYIMGVSTTNKQPPTQQVTPSVTKYPKLSKTPEPTKKMCKTGLNSFSLNTECEKDKFRYVEYSCYDGSKGKLGSETSCKSSNDWQLYAKKACEGKSSCKNTPIPSKKVTLTPKPTKYLTPKPTKVPPSPTPQPSNIPVTPTPTAKL